MFTHTRRDRRIRYKPISHGAVLVIISSTLLYVVHWLVYSSVKLSLPDSLRFGFDCTHYALWVLLPVTGWLAESWLGRYRAIIVGLLMCTITVIVSQFSFIMLSFNWYPILAFVLAVLALINGTFGVGSFYTNMLPFTLDQMIGASAKELSAMVQWYYWGFNISLLVRDVFQCIPFPKQLQQHVDIVPVVFLTIGSLSLSAVLVMDCLCHKWLDTHNKTGNPIKLIFQVLNYAQKNKYPRLRSAFTYIDEEQPSRLDFGKHKFGGPFTEEEVEDVKTVFRLTPILVCVFGAFLSVEFYSQFGLHAIAFTKHTFFCVSNLKPYLYYTIGFIFIPIYRAIYPCVYNYIPSMLKIMGAGLFLCLVNTLINLAIDSIGNFNTNRLECIFDDESTVKIPIPLYWVLIVESVNGVGVILTMCSLFEFVMAQTPNKMRGIMMGLMITVLGFGVLGNALLAKIFQQFQTATNCVFYYYLVLSLLMLLILVVHVVLAKRYKLRERDRHVNIQAIVEEHYERYFDQEEEYMRRMS